jgi:hypothetical protein
MTSGMTRRPVSNLPVPLTSFIGREDELSELAELSARTRLLTITGSGEAGKSRLTVELGRHLVLRFADGVVHLELVNLSDPVLLPGVVTTAFGLQEAPGRSPLSTLVDFMRDRELLLLLDNCEHLLGCLPAPDIGAFDRLFQSQSLDNEQAETGIARRNSLAGAIAFGPHSARFCGCAGAHAFLRC